MGGAAGLSWAEPGRPPAQKVIDQPQVLEKGEKEMPYLRTVPPEEATGKAKKAYDMLREMAGRVPQIYIAQSIRPDLLELIVLYNKALFGETHALSRQTKELIAAHVSKLNSCEY